MDFFVLVFSGSSCLGISYGSRLPILVEVTLLAEREAAYWLENVTSTYLPFIRTSRMKILS
jgi:hypothetical protein